VRWQFADDRFTQVAVERSTAADGAYERLAAEPVVENGVSTVIDRTVEAGRTYWYR